MVNTSALWFALLRYEEYEGDRKGKGFVFTTTLIA